MEKAIVNPPPLTDGDIRAALIQLARASTVQAKAMTAHANQELVPYPHQQVTTVTSPLRDFTRINCPTFYRSKIYANPQEFIYEVYKILLAKGFTTSEKAKLATYRLKDVAQE